MKCYIVVGILVFMILDDSTASNWSNQPIKGNALSLFSTEINHTHVIDIRLLPFLLST